jgi:hypothetical protein
MKNMKHLSIIALSLAVLASFSCAKDYLDTAPTGDTSPATIFETTGKAAVAVNGLGKIMHRQYGAYGQGYNGEGTVRLYYGDYLGNNLMKGNSTTFKDDAIGARFVNNTANLDGFAWYYYYTLIGNANTILKNIDAAEGTDGDRAYIKAQTLTYRAYAYFNLAQIYGRRWSDGQDKPSVVLRLTGEEPDNLDRSTQGEVYKQIYADLDEAIAQFNASGKANSRSSKHIMDLDVAYALYARVALTREDWNTALKYAQQVRKGYPLMSVKEEQSGFCEPNGEWIWFIYGAEDETLYYYDYFCYASYNASTSTTRNYPLLISRKLFEQIPETDIRRAFWLDPAGYEGTFNTNTMKANKQDKTNALWVYGQDYATKDGRVGILSNSCVFAYMNFKIHNVIQPGIGNLCLFRASEMLLIEAECQYRLNNEAAAQALLVELNATSKRDPAYTCEATGDALMEQIKFYRGLELWGEGFNWFDLKRWGDSIDRQTYKNGGNWYSSYAVSFGPHEKNNWTYIIPRQETDYNKGITSTSNE